MMALLYCDVAFVLIFCIFEYLNGETGVNFSVAFVTEGFYHIFWTVSRTFSHWLAVPATYTPERVIRGKKYCVNMSYTYSACPLFFH